MKASQVRWQPWTSVVQCGDGRALRLGPVVGSSCFGSQHSTPPALESSSSEFPDSMAVPFLVSVNYPVLFSLICNPEPCWSRLLAGAHEDCRVRLPQPGLQSRVQRPSAGPELLQGPPLLSSALIRCGFGSSVTSAQSFLPACPRGLNP